MKTKLFNFIIIGTLLVTGVVSAQGWQPPEDNFPNGNANAPVHVGEFTQRKSGGFWAKYFYAGTQATNTELSKIIGDIVGFVAGNKVMVAPTGIFTRVLLPGNNAHLRVGTTQGDDNGSGLFNASSESPRAPAVIDLQDRSGSHQVDAVAMLKNSAVCTTDVAMVTNTPAIHFWSDENRASADLIARQIRLAGGNPTPGAVLVSVDGQGNAVWGIPKMEKDGSGWKLVYTYDESPVKIGQLICEAPQPVEVPGCMIPGYDNYNPKATVSDNSCKCEIDREYNTETKVCEKKMSWKIITFTTPPPSEPPTKSGSSWQGCDVYWLDALRKSYGTNARFRVVGMTYNPNSPSDLAMISMYENQTIPENHPNFFIPINGLGSCLYRSEMGGGQGCYIHEMSKIPGVNNGNGTNPDVKRPPANNYAAKICRGYNINIETLDPFNPGGGNTTPTNSVSGYFLYQFQVYE